MQKLKLAHKTVLFFMLTDVNLKINPSSFKSHERLYSLIALFFYQLRGYYISYMTCSSNT